jgi:RNA polymerase sigma-70 factor (ECF subfamily)
VYAYVASMLRDRSAAEEVTAQAFERAYRRRSTFRPARGSAEAWLFGIARHAALDELRRLRRRATLQHEPEDPDGPPADDHVDGVIRRETVRAAMAQLEPRDRDLVALKYHADLSNAEIGQLIGLSESNVGTRLHRVLEKLRGACRDAA